MASSTPGFEAQDALFDRPHEHVPDHLARATFRMDFPPSYVLVGLYRFCTDKLLYIPAWDKCRHAARRGAIVGAVWFALTFNIQRKFIEFFLSNSSSVTGLSHDTMFGYRVPFNVHTYAALVFLGRQVTFLLKFFLSRNINIARERAFAQTVTSRGKGPEFWQPYVEEWDAPPTPEKKEGAAKFVGSRMGRMALRWAVTTALLPFDLYPFVGMVVSAAFKALGTAEYLHKPYFAAKKMTPSQIAVFVAERKWDYRTFGFTAALLEGIPIVGIGFSISNRVGAAMWAFDLEKHQHYVAEQKRKGGKSQ
ncbi:hypothetical protein BDN72DRAFT_799982 [Pluteus cervinus]|uniref:Uncharacterized protein n=1 Tax=Pluteus cervinus TaxID=181527 RepID=A0ACD3AKI2_9AGAR|nr:hypothetical protein BDN72DRAFT_799982 [Pluteus cervinus]